MANEHYSEFIKEAFIEPIRSVLIVDDDYPTFDEILKVQETRNAKGTVDSRKSWYENPERIARVINRFRTSDAPLLVDIHDGTNVKAGDEMKVAGHLHQSDLLVLDYQLDKSKASDGTRAIQIVRSLMMNDHFNLVVVHTSENLDFVFREVLVGLMRPSSDNLSPDEVEEVDNLIEIGEQAFEDFSKRVFESVANEQYFHSRLYPKSYLRTMGKSQEPYTAFSVQCDAAGWTNKNRRLVLRYVLARVERNLRTKMNVKSGADLVWSPERIKWIKSDSMFIAFSNKNDDDDLLAELQAALNDWHPQPSRLFLAMLRAEMDEYGVVAQSQALGNKYALAHWYDRLLNAKSPDERRWYIAESVSRHSDQLMGAILPRVERFVKRLIAAEVKNGDVEELCKQHFKIDLAKPNEKLEGEREHNAFVCSKNPEGWHLTTGHIFDMDDGYWVCLSPACDMVPVQLSKERKDMFGKRLPFIAVKLHPIRDGIMPADIQSNRFVFLNLKDGVKGFCFSEGNDNSAPHWHTLYAEKKGVFAEAKGMLAEKKFNFTVSRTEIGKKNLISKRHNAKVVSQLRYEYALNLMQRLGVSLTRVGLDFAP